MNIVTLNNRQMKLLEVLLQAKHPLSLRAAAEKCHLTICDKTLRADFLRIQEFSKGYHVTMTLYRSQVTVSAQEEDIRNLAKVTVALYQNSNIAYTDDRVPYIVLDCLLLDKIPSLDMWSERFNVSRPCIQNDMKKVKRWFSESQMTLLAQRGKGFQLEGSEFLIRKALVRWLLESFGNDIITMFSQQKSDFYQNVLWNRIMGEIDMAHLIQVVSGCLSLSNALSYQIQYNTLLLYLGLIVQRNRLGYAVTEDMLPQGCDFVPSPTAMHLTHILEEEYHLELSDGETSALQCIYQNMDGSWPKAAKRNVRLAQVGKVIVEEILRAAELLLNLPFSSDARFYTEFSELVNHLINHPDRGIGLGNIELANFSEMYPAEFALGQRLIPLARQLLGIEIAPSRAIEVGIFISANIERLIYSKRQRKNILLTVPGNPRMEMLIYWQLMNRLGDLMNHFEIAPYQDLITKPLPKDIDYVLSTIQLNNLGLKNITIPQILTETDIARLRRQLQSRSHSEKIPTGIDPLNAIITFYDEQSQTAEELFQQIGYLLESMGYVYAGYARSLLEHEETFGSGIEMEIPIAVPHTDKMFTKKHAIAIVVTKTPISVQLVGSRRKSDTQIALFPLFEPADTNAGLAFYSILSKLRDKKTAAGLKNCKSASDIEKFIQQKFYSG